VHKSFDVADGVADEMPFQIVQGVNETTSQGFHPLV